MRWDNHIHVVEEGEHGQEEKAGMSGSSCSPPLVQRLHEAGPCGRARCMWTGWQRFAAQTCTKGTHVLAPSAFARARNMSVRAMASCAPMPSMETTGRDVAPGCMPPLAKVSDDDPCILTLGRANFRGCVGICLAVVYDVENRCVDMQKHVRAIQERFCLSTRGTCPSTSFDQRAVIQFGPRRSFTV